METYKFGGRFVDNDNKKTIYIWREGLFAPLFSLYFSATIIKFRSRGSYFNRRRNRKSII